MYQLPSSCTIETIKEIHAGIKALLAEKNVPLKIDGAGVTQCDLTLMQLLVALKKATEFSIESPSEALQNTLTLYQLESVIPVAGSVSMPANTGGAVEG